MANLLLVDDNPIVRSVLKFLIEESFPACSVDEANDGKSSIEKIKKNNYDLIMLDINIPDTESVDHVNHLLAIQPGLKILMFGINHEEVNAKRYLKIGLRGFLAKDDSEKQIKTAVKAILENKKYVSPKLTQLLSDDLQDNNIDNPFNNLSLREFEIAPI